MRHWVITPYHYERLEEFDQCWHYDSNNGVIAIGWDMGDVTNLPIETMRVRYDRAFPGHPGDFHQVRKFWREILPGDRIIARAGRKRIIGLGTVNGSPYYSLEEWGRRGRGITYTTHPNFLPVRWDDTGGHIFSNQVFGIQTVTEMTEKSKHKLAIKAALGCVWPNP